jgi:glycine/D-amino acid oxidase-like deaminating enzyme
MAFEIKRGALPDALYWDTEDPYHYVRLQPDPGPTDYVLVGGEDHKSGQVDDADQRFEKLEAWARDRISALGKETHRWSGQVLDTIDYAGFIGRDPGAKNIFVAMGDSGQGLTHGVMGAMLNTGLIMGEDHPWEKLYSPARIPLKAAKNFVTETQPRSRALPSISRRASCHRWTISSADTAPSCATVSRRSRHTATRRANFT